MNAVTPNNSNTINTKFLREVNLNQLLQYGQVTQTWNTALLVTDVRFTIQPIAYPERLSKSFIFCISFPNCRCHPFLHCQDCLNKVRAGENQPDDEDIYGLEL